MNLRRSCQSGRLASLLLTHALVYYTQPTTEKIADGTWKELPLKKVERRMMNGATTTGPRTKGYKQGERIEGIDRYLCCDVFEMTTL